MMNLFLYSFSENRLVYEKPPKGPDFKLGGEAEGAKVKVAPEKPKVKPSDASRKMGDFMGGGLENVEKDQQPSFDVFMTRLDTLDPKKKEEFSKWAATQTDPELLKRAGVEAKVNNTDVLEKHVKLASEYLTKAPNENGHFVFTVDFKGNEVAEWKIGAGNLLPPVVQAVKIYDGKKVVAENAMRKVKNGRVGYFNNGRYVPIHSGYKIEVLAVQDPADQEVGGRIKEENDLFEKDGKKVTVKDKLEKFFKEKNLDVKVDDAYFAKGIDGILGKFNAADPNWWSKYLDGTFGDSEFNATFEQIFTAQDLIFIQNLCKLRQLQESWRISKKDESTHEGESEKQREEREEMERLLEKSADNVIMSDLDRLKKDSRFDELKKPDLSDDALYDFAQNGFENGGGYSEMVGSVVENGKEVSSNEPFVSDIDSFGNSFKLRASAMAAFKVAMQVAERNDPTIVLKINSSHRGIENQQGIFQNALKKYGSSQAARKWAALPGSSPHHTGGAMDVAAIVGATKGVDGLYHGGTGGVKHPNQKYLKTILPRAGFVNYDAEPWHWEIYTKRWRRITGNTSTPLYANHLDAVKKSETIAYNDYVSRESAAA